MDLLTGFYDRAGIWRFQQIRPSHLSQKTNGKIVKNKERNFNNMVILGRQIDIKCLSPVFEGMTMTLRFYRKGNEDIGLGFA